MMKQTFNKLKKALAVFSIAAIMCQNTEAQPGTVLFHETFGTPAGRTFSQYANKGANAFTFADPNLVYTQFPANSYEYKRSKLIENNHYAIVAPQNIYTSAPGWDAGGFTYQIWQTLITKNDATNDPAGGVMVVNAGTTRGGLYKRPVTLQRGRYYKLSFSLYVENPNVQLRTLIFNGAGTVELGSNLSTSQTTNNGGNWVPQVEYFYLPAAACANTDYNIAIENYNLNDFGNDFAIDEIHFEEVTAAEATGASGNLTVVAATCDAVVTNIVANNDASLNNTPGTSVIVPILSNDTNKDGVQATGLNVGFEFIVPLGSTRSTDWAGSPTITVPGEGSWTYDLTGTWSPTYGKVTFTPVAGFTGNPTPMQYLISNEYTDGTTSLPARVSSAPATITIGYTGTPTATNDQVTVPAGSTANISILTNDLTSTSAQASVSNVTVSVRNPSTGIVETSPATNPVVVPGEGSWSYNTTTGQLSFTPISGFTGTPTPVTYTIQDNATLAKSSAVASVATVTSTTTTVSGQVFIDANGLKNSAVDGTAYNTVAVPQPNLYAVLVDAAGLVVGSSIITNGAYSIPNVAYDAGGTNYTLQLSSTNPTVGSNFTGVNATYPANATHPWISTGEATGGAVQGTTGDGKISLTLTGPVTDANFGIQQLSNVVQVNTQAPNNQPLNTPYVLDNADQILTGIDPEDGSNITTGGNFVITAIQPGTKLFYDGHEITSAELATAGTLAGPGVYVISNYDPLKLAISFTTDQISTGFSYTLLDNAGFAGTAKSFTVSKSYLLAATGLSLKGSRQSANAQLTWSTQTEVNTLRFELQRSLNGNDFSNIAQIAASGNSVSVKTYSATDADAPKTAVYYRIKLTDIDGSVSFSNTILLQPVSVLGKVQVYPNPVKDKFSIVVDKAGSYQFQLMDINGRVVATRTATVTNALERQEMSMPANASGAYMLKIISTETNQSNFIKMLHQNW